MRVLVRALAVVCLGLALPALASTAQAQQIDPARMAAAKEMMEAARVERQFEQMMPLLLSRMQESFRSLAPERRALIDGVFEQIGRKFAVRRSELIAEIAGVYAQKLDAAELKAITEFYKSPAGLKFIEAQPQIMQESMAAGQRWGQQIAREIEEEARRELKKHGVDL
jgi:hypothetical protein